MALMGRIQFPYGFTHCIISSLPFFRSWHFLIRFQEVSLRRHLLREPQYVQEIPRLVFILPRPLLLQDALLSLQLCQLVHARFSGLLKVLVGLTHCLKC